MIARRATLLAATAALLVAGTATAQAENYYVGAAAGAAKAPDIEFAPGEIESDWGWAAGGTLGYRMDNNLRGELEVLYREGDAVGPTDGDLSSVTTMANLLYDFPVAWSFRPYIGAGIGAAQVEPDFTPIDDGAWAFAYQGIAGVGYRITPALELFADYRYLRTEGLDITVGGFSNDEEYSAHTALGGVRWHFATGY